MQWLYKPTRVSARETLPVSILNVNPIRQQLSAESAAEMDSEFLSIDAACVNWDA
jgi:hypothetical protein